MDNYAYTLKYIVNGEDKAKGFDDHAAARSWKARQERKYGKSFQYVSFRKNGH